MCLCVQLSRREFPRGQKSSLACSIFVFVAVLTDDTSTRFEGFE